MMHQIPEWYQKHMNKRVQTKKRMRTMMRAEKLPDKPDDEDHEMEEETLPEPDTAATSSSSRGEKRTETQENVFVKRRLMAKSPKRPITSVPPPEDPVKRKSTEENGHEKRCVSHEC